MVFAFISPESARIAIPVAFVVGYGLYHGWRWRMTHPRIVAPVEPTAATSESTAAQSEVKSESVAKPEPETPKSVVPSKVPVAGEREFLHAQAMTHRAMPTFKTDGLYLDLLGESAGKGYPAAMAKLGEYARLRGTWVEAYYWMYRASRAGQAGVEDQMSIIMRNWMLSGCPAETDNVNDNFDEARGSVGRALLDIATGRNAESAREFLQAHYPDVL